jgi:SAM-dependent methyltransferase
VPVDRYYISEFIAENCADIQGHVVEVGDRHYTRRFGGGKVTVSDVLMPRQDRSVTIEADLRNAPQVADGSFDCVIATQVLECIDEFHLATSTIYRILKPGGVALVTLPSIQRLDNPHEWPLLWGFSDGAAKFMFERHFGEGNSAIRAYGNILSATAFLYGLAAHELTYEELNHRDPDYQVIVGVRARKPDAN